jgi:hypothetical protein
VDRAGEPVGYNSRTTNVPENLSDVSRPWNKNTVKTQPTRKKNPSQSLAKTSPNQPITNQQQHNLRIEAANQRGGE